jgi:hypothetical protein
MAAMLIDRGKVGRQGVLFDGRAWGIWIIAFDFDRGFDSDSDKNSE